MNDVICDALFHSIWSVVAFYRMCGSICVMSPMTIGCALMPLLSPKGLGCILLYFASSVHLLYAFLPKPNIGSDRILKCVAPISTRHYLQEL